MDIFGSFDSLARSERGKFANDRSLQFTARRDMLDGATLTVECGAQLLEASAGLHADEIFGYPGFDWQSAADAMVKVQFKVNLLLLARIVNLAPSEEPIWIRSNLSSFPLATFSRQDIPNNFVTREYVDHILAKVGRNHWWTGSVFVRDGLMHVEGWAVPPERWTGGPPSVLIDGIPATSVQPAVSPWARSAYWFFNGRIQTGFYATGKFQSEGGYSKIEVSFGEADRAANVRRFPVYQFTSTLESLSLPVPPDKNIHRVSGPGANKYSYINGGKSDFERFRTLIAEKGGWSSLKGLKVLDWGIGCGRLARHFIEEGADVTGIDIDVDNIEWCKANLKPAQHVVVPLLPPTPLSDSSFDVIISSSVLSHLTEPVMRSWLTELSRVLRPNGVALLSFNGDGNSYFYGSVHAPAIAALDGYGFYDEWKTPDLDGFIDDSEYYRLTLMNSNRARQIFSEQMKFEDIVLGVTSGHQDLAVLRKK